MEVDEGPSELRLSVFSLRIRSAQLELICTISIIQFWLWLPDLIKVIAFCYTTRARAISVVTKPRHRVVITRHIPHILSRNRAGTGHRTTPR